MNTPTTNRLRDLLEAMLEGDEPAARARCDRLGSALRVSTEMPARTEIIAMLAQMLAVELMRQLSGRPEVREDEDE